mmetsp:Transcript_135483/g.235594  ORF Transcript_135483/g.235594 Transcript_135483/m.235594 type:complete len:109 (+) Transcript_135483:61-387(+)
MMDKDDKVSPYKTIKRLQKNYLVRCNESLDNIIPGNGVKPASLIRRLENEIAAKRKELGEITEQELLSQMDNANQRKQKNVAELASRRNELTERIKALEKELSECEVL